MSSALSYIAVLAKNIYRHLGLQGFGSMRSFLNGATSCATFPKQFVPRLSWAWYEAYGWCRIYSRTFVPLLTVTLSFRIHETTRKTSGLPHSRASAPCDSREPLGMRLAWPCFCLTFYSTAIMFHVRCHIMRVVSLQVTYLPRLRPRYFSSMLSSWKLEFKTESFLLFVQRPIPTPLNTLILYLRVTLQSAPH